MLSRVRGFGPKTGRVDQNACFPPWKRRFTEAAAKEMLKKRGMRSDEPFRTHSSGATKPRLELWRRKIHSTQRAQNMNFEEFQQYARLFVLAALDEEEMVAFEEARREFGVGADDFIQECRNLNAAFALSLRPQAPRADAREKLLSMVRASLREKQSSQREA
jgi:hypothetical protein